jgi:hypothetical protein
MCRFHVASSEKLHADKQLSGALIRSVAKLAGINLRKCGSFSYWFDYTLVSQLRKTCCCAPHTFLLGFPTECLTRTIKHFSGAISGEKEDFCKGSLSRSIFYFVIILLYFIFTCIILSKIQKK